MGAPVEGLFGEADVIVKNLKGATQSAFLMRNKRATQSAR